MMNPTSQSFDAPRSDRHTERAHPSLADLLALIVPPVLLLTILEFARYSLLANATLPALGWPWSLLEIVLILIMVIALAYWRWMVWYLESERFAHRAHELVEALADREKEKRALIEQSDNLLQEVNALKDEKNQLQSKVEALQNQPTVNFLTDDYPWLLNLMLQGNLSEQQALGYLAQAARVVAVFHAQNVPFALAPDTVVVDAAKNTVFLRQRLVGIQNLATRYEGFSAPEVLTNAPTLQSDVYALGALLFSFYTRQMPPTGSDLVRALEHLNLKSEYFGMEYLLHKSLWQQPQSRLNTANDFLALLGNIVHRQNHAQVSHAEQIHFDVGADFNVGLSKGRNRGANASDNEDRLFWDMNEGANECILAVADGVTRSNIGTGYQAASLFADGAAQLWGNMKDDTARDAAKALQQLFIDTNTEIVRAVSGHLSGRAPGEEEATMATAACAVIAKGGHATVANVGDVRLYLATREWVGKVTWDDTVISTALSNPLLTQERRTGLSTSTLDNYLGRWSPAGKDIAPVEIKPHFASFALLPGDTLVLVSDGAYRATGDAGELFADTLLKILASTNDAQVAAFRLMSIANQRSGSDNITCVVCRCME